MASTILLSDNGASSGSAGYKTTAGNDGVLILQTTTSGGTATNALYIDNNQNVGVGTTPSSSSSNWRGINVYNATYQGRLSDGSAIVSSNLDIGGNNYLLTGYASYYYQVSGAHKFYSAPSGSAGTAATATLVMQVDRNSTLALQSATQSSGTGIAFPATQSASSDANTLDDYEEGTWTPTLARDATSNTVTYANQLGSYTKVGNLVFITGYISGTQSGGSGVYLVGGMPFTVKTGAQHWSQLSTADFVGFTFPAGCTQMGLETRPTDTKAYLLAGGSAATSSAITTVGASFTLYFSGCYIAA